MLIKRLFDIFFSFIGLVSLSWLILILWIIAALNTRSNGFFLQQRVGLNGELFNIIKIKTMIDYPIRTTNVTVSTDPRITGTGKIMRLFKLDELPSLFNVFIGDMSFVGPRPDVPGYADKLVGHERKLLSVRPGITSPATLKYADEEKLLAVKDNPKHFNDEVLYPEKVKLNLEYILNWSLWMDIKIIFKTVFRKNY